MNKHTILTMATVFTLAIALAAPSQAQSINPTFSRSAGSNYILTGFSQPINNGSCYFIPDKMTIRYASTASCEKSLQQIFGSWQQARRAAGIDEGKVNGVYTSLVQALQQLNNASMGSFSGRYMQSSTCATIIAYTQMQRACSPVPGASNDHGFNRPSQPLIGPSNDIYY